MNAESKYETIPDDHIVEKTAEALKKNGINTIITRNSAEAKKIILELIPQGAEVMTMTSTTSDSIDIINELNSGNYNSVRNKIMKMDRNTQSLEMQKLGAAPEYVVGSVHAVTQDGKAMIASATGSQLPAYAYGSSKVIWAVGAQKIVKNFEEGLKRIYDYTLPLESERARKAYGVPGSAVNKLLVINNEAKPGRITMIIIKEKLGF
ncbi:LUD domain-containing protein [Candidatus Woesearchaeota archaeon]|nr:LUD domain-containing protein [Candidatus Woesearchaeota archaeon]